MNIRNGAAMPVALFHAGCCEGSAITLEGTEGGGLAISLLYLSSIDRVYPEKMQDLTTIATTNFDRAPRNMEQAASYNYIRDLGHRAAYSLRILFDLVTIALMSQHHTMITLGFLRY